MLATGKVQLFDSRFHQDSMKSLLKDDTLKCFLKLMRLILRQLEMQSLLHIKLDSNCFFP